MSGRPLTPDEVAALAARKTTPGPWVVSVVRGTIRAVCPDDPRCSDVVVQCSLGGWLAEGDPYLLAAAQDLLATSQHLLQRAEKAEGRASEWEQTGREAVDSVLACDVELDDAGVAAGPLPERMRSLLRQRDEARANYAFMVERAADQRLDGYRELGAKCAALEAERDALRAEVARLQAWQREILETLSGGDVTAENAVSALSHALRDGAACYIRATRAEREREALRSEVAALRHALAGRGCT